MNPPRISIIIPSFNQGNFLETALQSVISQKYPNLELLVFDGKSGDNSLDIIRKYNNYLTYWESVYDRGQSHAINKGFKHSTGEIITFLSSDDYYLPGTLDDVAKQFCSNPLAGAIIGAFCFLDEGQPLSSNVIMPYLEGPSPVDLTLGPPSKYRLHQVSTFYTRTALDFVGRFVREDMRYVMDRELLYRVCRHYSLVLSHKPYGVFRRHIESKSVAELIPFAREFAHLYELAFSGDPNQDKLRKKMASYRLARGYLKYANAVRFTPKSIFALLHAGYIYPSLFLSSSYWKKYLHLLVK